MRFHPVKRLELESQQPFLVKKMAPRRKATNQTKRNNKVWTDDETNKYANILCGTENGDRSWLYQLENYALKKQANEELFREMA